MRAARLAELAKLVDANKIAASEPAGKVMERMMEVDAPAEKIAADLGLLQVSDDSAVDAAIEAVIAKNPQPLADYRAGKQAAMGALVGMVMKSAKGLNPRVVQERLRQRLG